MQSNVQCRSSAYSRRLRQVKRFVQRATSRRGLSPVAMGDRGADTRRVRWRLGHRLRGWSMLASLGRRFFATPVLSTFSSSLRSNCWTEIWWGSVASAYHIVYRHVQRIKDDFRWSNITSEDQRSLQRINGHAALQRIKGHFRWSKITSDNQGSLQMIKYEFGRLEMTSDDLWFILRLDEDDFRWWRWRVWVRMINNDTRWAEMKATGRWWLQVIVDNCRWSKMASDDRRWHQKIRDDYRWSEMTSGAQIGLQMINFKYLTYLKWSRLTSDYLRWSRMTLDDQSSLWMIGYWPQIIRDDMRWFLMIS